MARWLVTQADNQFAVDDLDELKKLAKRGNLVPGDMVQPPGATEWLYAIEIPELKGLLREDDVDLGGGMGRTMVVAGIAVGLLGVLGIGGIAMAYFYSQATSNTVGLVGSGGLQYTQMLVTLDGAPLHADPDEKSPAITTLTKDTTVDLLAKRGEFYRARAANGQEGWVAVASVLPMYQLGNDNVRNQYDPLYNPDRYVKVSNASWMMQDERDDRLTVFRFELENLSKYPMTDLKLLATVKDSKGTVLEKDEIPIEGNIPSLGNTMVGTLDSQEKGHKGEKKLLTTATFDDMAKTDPDLQLHWSDGIEVKMQSKDFTTADITLLEVRAEPDAAAQKATGGAPPASAAAATTTATTVTNK